MSAFGGKADITIAACPLLRSLLGVKRTWPIAVQMSAYDPKRTSMRDAFQQMLLRETDMDLELTFAFDEVVLANALDEKKSTIRRLSVRNEMFGVWGNFIAASDF